MSRPHLHPHTDRIAQLQKAIEQDGYLVDDYRREQNDAQAAYLKPSTKYTELREIADRMRSLTGKIAATENRIEANKKELEYLQGSDKSPT